MPRLMTLFVSAAVALAAGEAAAQTFEGRDYSLFDGRPGGAGPAPLVLVLHGGGGSGTAMRNYSGFDRAARRSAVVAVYPDAPGGRWNDGRWTALGDARTAARDDAGYLLRLGEHLRGRLGLGEAPVYLVGISNGGGMALLMSCTAPGRIAGIAVIATKMLLDVGCPDPDPLPALFLHGTSDRLSPHDGRSPGSRQARRLGATLSSDATHALWVARNRCDGSGVATAGASLPESGVRPVTQIATGCAAPLTRVVLEGGGHGFPGARPLVRPLQRHLMGPAVPDYDAAGTILAFFGLRPR